MAFTFQQAATNSTTGATSLAATFANAPVSGELIVATVATNSSTASVTAPAGFSTKVSNANTSRSIGIYWKIAGSGESTSYTFNFGASIAAAIVMRRFSSDYGWNTNQSSGASNYTWDSTSVSSVSTSVTTTANRLVIGCGYSSNTTSTNKQLNPNSGWSDNTLLYSNRTRSAYRTAVGGSESFGYQLTDAAVDTRLAIMAAEFVEYTTKTGNNSTKSLATSWNDRKYSDSSKAPSFLSPNSLSATPSGSTLTVSFTDRTSGWASHKVYLSSNSGSTWPTVVTKSASVTSHSFTSLAAGAYLVKVVATFGGADAAESGTTASGTINTVNVPASFAVNSSGTTNTVSWTDTNTSAAQTVIDRSTDSGSTWTNGYTTVAAGTNSYADTGLSAGTYTYRARAKIGTSYSSYTSSQSGTVTGVEASFYDTFESGNLSGPGAPFVWDNGKGGVGVISSTRAYAGTYSVKIPSYNSGGQLPFDVGAEYRCIRITYRLWIPSDYQTTGSGMNNKLIRVWCGGDTTNGADSYDWRGKMGASVWCNSTTGGYMQIDGPASDGSIGPVGSSVSSFFNSSMRGAWHELKWLFRGATTIGGADSTADCWLNGTNVVSLTGIPSNTTTRLQKFQYGYINGWANTPYVNNPTDFYVDNVLIECGANL